MLRESSTTGPTEGEIFVQPASASAGAWVDCALANLPALLDDHCQCELKAASNALALIGRHPERESMVNALHALAREELRHYAQVRRLQLARGGSLSAPLKSPYVQALQKQRDRAVDRLLDELLVAAVIEARSCERFERVSAALAERADPSLLPVQALYEGLIRSERGHAGLFLRLAEDQFGAQAGEQLERRLRLEAELLDELPLSPRMHGGHR